MKIIQITYFISSYLTLISLANNIPLYFNDLYEKYCFLKCENKTKNIVCQRSNIACKPARACGRSRTFTLAPLEIEAIVKEHNRIRQKVTIGQYDLPKASNMRNILYNSELALSAQCLANTCKVRHDECRVTPSFQYVGQNIIHGRELRDAKSLRFAIQNWTKDIKSLEGEIDSYSGGSDDAANVIWAETYLVGCGRNRVKDGIFFVCNYYPEIERGKPIYLKGEPCSNCSDLECNTDRHGLCGRNPQQKFQAQFSSAESSLKFNILFLSFLFKIFTFYEISVQ